jgi:hypothetical protein
MLINSETRGGSVVVELVVSLALVIGVGVGVYQIQHAHTAPSTQMAAATQQQ